MENINQLICYLLAIASYAKDIHYTVHNEAFYGKHLLADRIYDGLYDFMDLLKETCLLCNEIEPLPSGEYLSRATSLIPPVIDNDKTNFENMKNLLLEALSLMDSMKDMTRGESSLIDNISQDLQQKLGLVNLQVKD